MIYEFRINADSEQEVHDALTAIAASLLATKFTGNVISFACWNDASRGQNFVALGDAQQAGPSPLPEPRPVTAAAPVAAAPAPAPKKKGPVARVLDAGKPAPVKAPAPASTLVDGPDGEPAAVMTESIFGESPPADPQTPLEQRDAAIAILQAVFANPAGPPAVRALQTRLKVKKFNEVPEDQCAALLVEAQALQTRLQATAA